LIAKPSIISPLVCYAVVFVIAPEIGQVTETVANSPTEPDTDCHSVINAENPYAGFVVDVIALVGFTVIATAVPILVLASLG
jgi:hypothetical protein